MTVKDLKILNNGKTDMLLESYMDASKLETSKQTCVLVCPNVWSHSEYIGR